MKIGLRINASRTKYNLSFTGSEYTQVISFWEGNSLDLEGLPYAGFYRSYWNRDSPNIRWEEF